jgi:hypothetical protein
MKQGRSLYTHQADERPGLGLAVLYQYVHFDQFKNTLEAQKGELRLLEVTICFNFPVKVYFLLSKKFWQNVEKFCIDRINPIYL